MKLSIFTFFILSAYLTFGQTSVVLVPTRDTPFAFHDNYNTENINYNNALHFAAFAQPGNSGGMNTGRAALDFDLSPIPSGSTILGAFLNLTGIGPFGIGQAASVGNTGQNECTLSRITSP